MIKQLGTLVGLLLCSLIAAAQNSPPVSAPAPEAQTSPQDAGAPRSIDPYQAYADGRYADAFEGFANLQVKRPKDVDLMLNLGASLYRLKDYASAEKAWALAAEHGDPNVRAQALYNMGNSAFSQNNTEQAVQHFESALGLAPNDLDAQHNLRVAKKRLELEQQQDKSQDPNAPRQPQDPNQTGQNQPQEAHQQGPQEPNAPPHPADPNDAKSPEDPNASDKAGPAPDLANAPHNADGKEAQKPEAPGAASEQKEAEVPPAKPGGGDHEDEAKAPDTQAQDGAQGPKRMPRSQAERLLDAMGESRPRHAPPGDKAGQRPPNGMDW